MKTLGLDLGTNSLGWAILNDAAVENAGVLIFEEGVNREQSDSLETPAATRRAKRMARRLRFRRHMRRRRILKILIANGMCPLTLGELKSWAQDGVFPKDNRAFIDWLKSTDSDNPYCDRAKAASEKVDPLTLGRAVYHIALRRGFKSGRKDELEEGEGSDKDLGAIKSKIAQLSGELDNSGLTLGQYFYRKLQEGGKVRKRPTGRIQHYQKEWGVIAKKQGLTQALADEIARTLFWQRPLREQSHLVGRCPLERHRNRCHLAHPDFERFRALSFVNNIRTTQDDGTKVPIEPEERTVAAACFMRKSPHFEFKAIRKELEKKFKRLKGATFNYDDNTSIASSVVSSRLSDILGCDFRVWSCKWTGKKGNTVTHDWQTAFDALVFFDDTEKLLAFAKDRLGLADDKATEFSKIRIPEGRAAYSLHAIRKINIFLEKGIELSQAIFLAKLPDVIPAFDSHLRDIIAKVNEHNVLYRENKRAAWRDQRTENRIGVVPLEKRLRSWLEQDYNIPGEKFDTLYFRDPNADDSYALLDAAERRAIQYGKLPPVKLGMIRNPLVQRSMTTLRRLVNELRRQGAIDAETRIHIELARDVNDRNHRMAIQTWQKQNEENRRKAAEKLKEVVSNPSETDILKYLLAEEQKRLCLYTGTPINLQNLLTGFDLEHTLPRSRSGDASQANLTLCEANYNRNVKKGRIPTECPNYDEIEARLRPWREKLDHLKNTFANEKKIAKRIPSENAEARSKARQRMLVTKQELDYWRKKLDAFSTDAVNLTPSFMSRQLVDTGIMTRHAVALLKTVYRDVYPVSGSATAFARKAWGIQNQGDAKNRDSHVHHAVDAMVIAALDRARFNAVCTALKAEDESKASGSTQIPPPFNSFAQAVYDQTTEILVKHITRHNELKQAKRKHVRLSSPKNTRAGVIRVAAATGSTVRGQLHKESFYGKIIKPGETEMTCVIRKELNSANFASPNDIDKIIDRVVRERISALILQRGGDFKKAVDQGGFTMASGVPIKKVRVETTTVTNPKILRVHTATPSKHDYKTPYYVQPASGSNFRLAVYKGVSGEWHFISENLLDHVRGNVSPVPEKARLIGYILPGAMALAYQKEGEWNESGFDAYKRLYEVVKFTDSNNTITLRFHKEARRMKDLSAALVAAGKKGAGQSSVDFESPHELLLLNFKKAWVSFLFEGIHFKMGMDGILSYT